MPTPFEKAFATLNPDQKTAVTTIDGPVMVIAGPGTGKTQVLTLRIAQILQTTDTTPRAILALTFTESAAHTMRQRLLQFIGEAAYQVRIETFHAFCDGVIRSHPEYFPLRMNSQPLSDIEKFQIVEHLLDTMPLEALRTAGSAYHYLSQILKAISELKREGISPEKFTELVSAEQEFFEQEKDGLKKTALAKQEKSLAKMTELGEVFEKYQSELLERRRYDFDDMIRFVQEAFTQNEELLLEYQEQFLYVLVDEYQDTNSSQNAIVDQLASYWGEQANICVVGDPHQSIYRFQGASLENTLGFLQRYPEATIISLKTGYRSPQDIYTTASSVISHNTPISQALEAATTISSEKQKELELRLREPLEAAQKTARQNTPAIEVAVAATPNNENFYLVQQLSSLLKIGVDPEEIAVLYRTNADGQELQELCLKYELPVKLDQSQNILEAHFTQQLLQLLKVIISVREGQESGDVAEVLFAPWWNIPRLSLLPVVRAAGKTNMTVYQRVLAGQAELSKLQETQHLTPLDLVQIDDVIDRVGRWGVEERQQPLISWMEALFNEAGIVSWVMDQPEKMVLLSQLHALLAFTRQVMSGNMKVSLEELLIIIETMESHNLPITAAEVLGQSKGITFSTVHKAKGQEWEHVFLMRCVDGKWGNGRASRSLPLPSGVLQFEQASDDSDTQRLDDDRRLFYVALTRAKAVFHVSYAETQQSGLTLKPILGSLFLSEIPEELKTTISVVHTEKEVEHFLQKTLTVTPTTHWSIEEKAWLQKVTAEFALSVSALNTYLRSPEEFLHKYIFKIPQPQTTHQAFGTSMHSALEFVYRSWKDVQDVPATSEVLARYQQTLADQYLDEREYQRRLVQGQKVLTQFLETHDVHESQPLFVEKFFGYGATTTMLGDIRLNGQLDRVDWIDQEAKTVKVVDYKTGRSRTVNEILGKVSTSDYSERELALPEEIRGVYKRQLLFYKLLLQLDKTFPGTIVAGQFIYVEPEDSGKYVERQLDLPQEEVEMLKELIIEVMKEIRDLKFL